MPIRPSISSNDSGQIWSAAAQNPTWASASFSIRTELPDTGGAVGGADSSSRDTLLELDHA